MSRFSINIVAFWLPLGITILAIKLAMLAFDSMPLFYIGDSAVYLASAVSILGNPGDRSFTYGALLIRPLMTAFSTIKAVVITQTLLSCGSALLLAGSMRVGFRAPLWLAAITALVYTVEPLGLLYERMMMTEAVALFFLALFVFVSLQYIEKPAIPWLAVLALLSTCAVSLRTAFVPILLTCMAILPTIALFHQKIQYRRLLGHTVVSISLTLSLHAAYKQYFSYATGGPPSYNSGDGFFLLASWAPLVTRADFPDPNVYDRVVPTVRVNLTDRFSRPSHHHAPDGWVERLIADQSDFHRANVLAKAVALRVVERNPIGVLALGWRTYKDYWDRDLMHRVILVDQGQREIDESLINHFGKRYSEDISQHHLRDSPIKQWYRAAIDWYRLLLLTPLIAAATFLLVPRYRRSVLFIGVLVTGLIASNCLFAGEPVVRYLHSIEWLATMLWGSLAAACITGVRHNRFLVGRIAGVGAQR